MRKLERPSSAPTCLSHYQHGRHQWGAVSSQCKEEIWQHLEEMQGKFCAYCERKIKQKPSDAHIEHFFRRDQEPTSTFSWGNLFASCNDQDSCGRHKDNDKTAKNIDLNKVCKPDVLDPEVFLQFLPGGKVNPRQSLNESDKEIARNTIVAFNLNNSNLVGSRREVVRPLKKEAKTLFELLNESPNEVWLQQELNKRRKEAKSSQFSSALRAVWE